MSHGRRFLCPKDLDAPPWALPPEEARHAIKVLRLSAGDAVLLMDGCGGTVRARLSELTREGAVAVPDGPVERAPEPALRPWLLVGAPDPHSLDAVVEQATELGAFRILVARAERSPTPAESLERRLPRWEALVRSAGKQSGNPWFPRIGIHPSVREATREMPGGGYLLSQGGTPLADLLAGGAPAGDTVLAVGPEGDFTPAEVEDLLAGGLLSASLGPHTLRVGTACLASLACLVGAGPWHAGG